MKALILHSPGQASIGTVAEPETNSGDILLRVRMVGLCGSDLNSFRGLNPLVSYPRILGHEIAATVLEGTGPDSGLAVGSDVALSPYTSCAKCASCRRGRPNACQFNHTLGVQRDGALTELIVVLPEKLYPAKLTPRELCLVEPLTVGFHAVSRAKASTEDAVAIFGCGGVGLGAVAASNSRGACTIGIDVDDEKLARLAGARHTIHSKQEPVHDRLLEMTNGNGPDVVIEAVGTPATFRAAVEEVAFSGRVVYIDTRKNPSAMRPACLSKRNWTFWDREMRVRKIFERSSVCSRHTSSRSTEP